jgi:GNAT superfamily N-acetyltransferase
MIYRPIDTKDFELGMNIGWYSDLPEYNRAIDMFQLYPDLFVGCYDNDKLIGICYGWPEYIHRYDKLEMNLVIISMVPEYRRKGLGKVLIKSWEDQVKKRGHWMIGLGSGADMFYVKTGYTPIEHYFKMHKCQLSQCDKSVLAKASFVRYSEDPMVVLYFKTDGTYRADFFKELHSKLDQANGLHRIISSGTIFNKQL